MPPQYVNLMPEDQDLGHQRRSRPEQPDQHRPDKAAGFLHRTERLRDYQLSARLSLRQAQRQQHVAKMSFAYDDDMIDAFPADRTDQAVQHIRFAMASAATSADHECPWIEVFG
jgi:hypothetical protein